MTKTMVSGLLTWLCGLIMLMLLLASIPEGSAEQVKATTPASSPALEAAAPQREQ